MRCLVCNEDLIHDASLYSYLFNEELICDKCQSKLVYKRIKFKLDDVEVESFYEYNEAFKKIILQYKECFDEALSIVFIKRMLTYINIRYRGYTIVLCPSTLSKLNERGFNHLEEIFKHTKLKIYDILYKEKDITLNKEDYYNRILMKDNIKLKKNIKIPKKILIVDDVITSGNTMKGAISNFKNEKVKVKAFVIAYNNSWQKKMKAL